MGKSGKEFREREQKNFKINKRKDKRKWLDNDSQQPQQRPKKAA